MSAEGNCIPLIQVATSVAQALKDPSAVDAVQPIRNGWCIMYVQWQIGQHW